MVEKTKAGIARHRIAIAVMAVVLLAACDSGIKLIVPDIIDDDSSPIVDDDVVSADLVQLDGQNQQTFTLVEDTVLKGLLYTEKEPPDGDITLLSLPQSGNLQLASERRLFVYTPSENFWGQDSFRYMTFEGTTVDVSLMVTSVNDTPRLSRELPRVAEQGRLFLTTIVAEDAEDAILRFSAVGLPEWLLLDTTTGVLSGTARQQNIGFSDPFTLRVTDSTGLFDEYDGFRIEVIDVNDPPTLNLSQLPTEMNGRQVVSAPVFPDDPDGDLVSVEIEEIAFIEGMVTEGIVTLTASDVTDVTDVNVVIRATDELGQITREILPVRIYPLTESGNGKTIFGSIRGRGVHVVILGDGYTTDQLPSFRDHTFEVIDVMQQDPGIAAHIGAFNIHRIESVSINSGADDNEDVDSRDTYFDSFYNCRSIPRLICANTLTLFETALTEFPTVDQIILLVNDQRYGGSGNSGGSVAITSAFAPEIALHEMGHSLADLADEYVDNLIVETTGLPTFVEGRFPNVSAFNDPALVPWSHWIDPTIALPQEVGDSGVGVFEGGLYRPQDIFRPTYNSRMRSFDVPFGPVNSEEWVLRLYTLTEGIRGFSPLSEQIDMAMNDTQEFIISPIFGPDVQSVAWLLNDEDISNTDSPNSVTLNLPKGEHQLTVIVTDVSGVIRKSPPHAGIFTWTWTINVI